jgi:hypothetical protein
MAATHIFSTFCSLFGFSPSLTFTIELLWLSSSLVILFGSGSGLDDFQIPPHRQAVAVICKATGRQYQTRQIAFRFFPFFSDENIVDQGLTFFTFEVRTNPPRISMTNNFYLTPCLAESRCKSCPSQVFLGVRSTAGLFKNLQKLCVHPRRDNRQSDQRSES